MGDTRQLPPHQQQQQQHHSISATLMPEFVLLSGVSGSGKSAIMQAVQAPISRRCGLSISSKFELHVHHTHSCLLSAFQGLIQQLLAQSQEQLLFWRDELRLALNGAGAVLIEVLPSLQQIIGPQPDVPVIDAAKTSNRFNSTFVAFVSVFARSAHPLTIFIVSQEYKK